MGSLARDAHRRRHLAGAPGEMIREQGDDPTFDASGGHRKIVTYFMES
jgi:hypothetical protein